MKVVHKRQVSWKDLVGTGIGLKKRVSESREMKGDMEPTDGFEPPTR